MLPEDIKADLRANFEGECSEVGMYLAMVAWPIAKAILRSVVLGKGRLGRSRARSKVC